MKINKIATILSLLCCSAICSVSAQQTGLNDPMTKAMMEVYDQEIAANPKNADIYFRRANEYYKFNAYLRALSDIEKAIENTPKSDADMLFQCNLLKGQIYQMLKNDKEALAAFTEALNLDPTSFMALYQKANCEYELGMLAEAKQDYNRMRSINMRSAEALTGLARIALKENNLGLANQYMDDAVQMMPTDSDIYVRRASVRTMLGNNTGAVDDLLMAISLDNNGKAFQQLVNISDTDYPAVITALSNAVSQAPDQGMFYYIRAVIAQAHDHYSSAIADYRYIIDNNLYNYAGIYGSLAECFYYLADFQQALENANQAIGMTRDNGEYFITLSKIYLALDRVADASTAIDKALQQLPNNIDAQTQKGICLFAEGNFSEASTLFGSMIMDDPTNAMNYLMQAWVIYSGDKKPANATPIYKRLVQNSTNPDKPKSYYGFALLFSGKKAEAMKWIEKLLIDNIDTDGTLNYEAACLYAQADEPSKAFECLEKALNKGYGNLYNLNFNQTARINIAPLRSDPQLNRLISSYSYNFDQ